MRIFKIIALALALSLSYTHAYTQESRVIAEAYEVLLSDVRVPVTPSGSITFKQCEDCDPVTLRVTTQTTYEVNGKAVDLREFRRLVLNARNNDNAFGVIGHHLETDVIQSVRALIQ